MIRLGLRLALSGGRGAAIGLALTAFAVAAGTAILLFALSFLPALDDRAARAAWRTSFILSETGTTEGAGLLIRSDVDSYAGEPLVRVLVAGLIDAPPTPPGVDRLPGPGEAVVSPALAALLKTVPADQLGDRIGTVVGTVGDAGLRSPDELVAVIGLEPVDAGGARGGPDHRVRHDADSSRDPADGGPDDRARGHRCAGPGGGLRVDGDAPVGRRAASNDWRRSVWSARRLRR